MSVAVDIMQTRTRGCTRFTGQTAFVNAIPAAVHTLDRALTAVHRWRVVGRETHNTEHQPGHDG